VQPAPNPDPIFERRVNSSYVKGDKMSDDQTFERRVKSRAEREARKSFRSIEAEKAMTDHAKAQKHFHENRERLKAERLAREAEATGGVKKAR
jgi:hypothetical protein